MWLFQEFACYCEDEEEHFKKRVWLLIHLAKKLFLLPWILVISLPWPIVWRPRWTKTYSFAAVSTGEPPWEFIRLNKCSWDQKHFLKILKKHLLPSPPHLSESTVLVTCFVPFCFFFASSPSRPVQVARTAWLPSRLWQTIRVKEVPLLAGCVSCKVHSWRRVVKGCWTWLVVICLSLHLHLILWMSLWQLME